MSADRLEVWSAHHSTNEAICPVCNTTKMIKDKSKTWHQGHILGKRYSGPNHLFNYKPICAECNLTSKTHVTIYHQMVDIGTMTAEQAEQAAKNHKEFLAKLMLCDSKAIFHCIGQNKTTKKPCTSNKVGYSLCCKKHRLQEQHWIKVTLSSEKSKEDLQDYLRLLKEHFEITGKKVDEENFLKDFEGLKL